MFGPFDAAFMQLSYSGLRFCWEVQQEWAGRILQWDPWWMVLWQANSSFCPADVFVLYKDNDLVCHFSSYSFKEVWSTGYLQQWQQAMMMVAWQKRRGWWHAGMMLADEQCQQCLSGRVQLNVKPGVWISLEVSCASTCVTCCFLFFLPWNLWIARKIAKDHERCGTCLESTRFVFFCARFSVVMLPLAARFRVQKCGHDILQGPSSFVVETFCMKVFMKNCPFPTRRHLQLQLQLHRWALLVVGSPIISWIREALTLQANGKFTSQLGSLIADRAL